MEHEFNKEEWDWVDRMERLKSDFNDLDKITDKWGFFRQIYMEMIPHILERAKVNVVTPINPYPVDWGQFLSPIEFHAWQSIRSHYMALYPQFPVFNHFIDFANPYLRIGVEMDGKEYHDPEKDALRDAMLWKYGWRIFRIPGRECYVPYKTLDEIQQDYEHSEVPNDKDHDLYHWLTQTSDGVFYSIKMIYFLKVQDHEHYRYCMRSLDNHKGTLFPLTD
jgi:very-short-patch-repair endonuclease